MGCLAGAGEIAVQFGSSRHHSLSRSMYYAATATHMSPIRMASDKKTGRLQLTSDVKQRPLFSSGPSMAWEGRVKIKATIQRESDGIGRVEEGRVGEKRKEHTSAKVIARVRGCPRARSAHTYPSFSRSETGQKRETVTSSSEPTAASSSISRLFHGCSLSLTHPSGGASPVFALLSKS